MQLLNITMLLNLFAVSLDAGETFTPYQSPNEVPRDAATLWKDYDARKEPLDVQVIKEWKEDGVVTRYVTFKVGTFKNADARMAAYYSFPDNGKKNAAFVWSHGGGQGPCRIIIGRDEFKSADGKSLEWSKIATFEITIVDEETKEKLDLTSDQGHAILQLINLVN